MTDEHGPDDRVSLSQARQDADGDKPEGNAHHDAPPRTQGKDQNPGQEARAEHQLTITTQQQSWAVQ